MTQALQKIDNKQFLSEEQVSLIKRTIAKDADDDELKLFLYQAERTGLDPLSKQIYFQKHKNYKTGDSTITIITAIDGYRLVADRTGLYAGNDDPVFDDENKPSKASVTVWKLVGGVRSPFTATARWSEYYPGDSKGFMWKKMPCTMLGKCAEALALRKAFPRELSGVYTKEEMEQASDTIEVIHEPSQAERKQKYNEIVTAATKKDISPDELIQRQEKLSMFMVDLAAKYGDQKVMEVLKIDGDFDAFQMSNEEITKLLLRITMATKNKLFAGDSDE